MLKLSLHLVVAIAVVAKVESISRLGLKQIDSGERVFIEVDSGREIILHGVNAIVKGFPYVPQTNAFDPDISLTEKDHAMLADLGINVYRLGSMWPGVEPVRNQYNSTYIDELNTIVSSAGEYGIYSILDMHQDVFSEKYCGEGVPSWAAISNVDSVDQNFPFPLHSPYVDVAADGFPTRQDCALYNWPKYYNTYAAGSGFESLYKNVSGLYDSWAAYWAHLAATVGKGNNAVLGYELMNEPMGGDALSNPALFIPGVADRTVLQPAYDGLVAAIRQVDPDSLVLFAAVTWDDIVPVGFTAAPGGVEEAHRSVFAFHYYEPPQMSKTTYFHQRNKDARRLGTGSMLTEFERPRQSSGDESVDPFVAQADEADKFGLSWTMWEYKTFCKESEASLSSSSQQAEFGSCKTGYGEQLIFNANGERNDGPSRKLARTYVQATAGRLLSMQFNASTGDFRAVWRMDASIALPTEVFAHQELQYPSGMTVTVTPDKVVKWRMKSANVLSVHPTPLARDGEVVTLSIRRAV